MYSFSVNYQGTNLNDVLKPEDYSIRVGNVVCPVQKLKHHYLKCDLSEGIEKHNLQTAKANLTIGVCKSKNIDK